MRALPPGNWLVQAKLTVVPSPGGFGSLRGCGLVQGPVSNDATLLDQDSFAAVVDDFDDIAPAKVTSADVVTTTNTATTIGVRCLEEPTQSLSVEDVQAHGASRWQTSSVPEGVAPAAAATLGVGSRIDPAPADRPTTVHDSLYRFR